MRGSGAMLPSAAGCGAPTRNHYSKAVLALEATLTERLEQLQLLARENEDLKRREQALTAAIGSLQVRRPCVAPLPTLHSCPAPRITTAQASIVTATAAVQAGAGSSTAGSSSPPARGSPMGGVPHAAAVAGAAAPTAAAPAGAAASIADSAAFLLKMQQREQQVQSVMSALGVAGAYDGLYSTWLLRRAFSSPSRAAAHLAMDRQARLRYVVAAVQRFGLLLSKYDEPAVTSLGSARSQLDHAVNELSEHILTFCLLAPPARQLEIAMVNMDTGLPEAYPPRWFHQVARAMALTDDQKARLRICWGKVRPIKLALTAQHERLTARLSELQSLQLQSQHRFEAAAEHCMDHALQDKEASLAQLHASQKKKKQQRQEQGDVQLAQLGQDRADHAVSPRQSCAWGNEAWARQVAAQQPLWGEPAANAQELPQAWLHCVQRQSHSSSAAQEHVAAAFPKPHVRLSLTSSGSRSGGRDTQQVSDARNSACGGSDTAAAAGEAGASGSGAPALSAAPELGPPSHASALATSDSQVQRELLLQVFNHEQVEVEAKLDAITAQLKMQQYVMQLHIHNTCSKRQIAAKYVACHPWCPESFSICEALDELGW